MVAVLTPSWRSIHHVAEVKEFFQEAGIVLLFLPPYSPDLNPVEEAFSYVKNFLHKHDKLLQEIISELLHLLQSAGETSGAGHLRLWHHPDEQEELPIRDGTIEKVSARRVSFPTIWEHCSNILER